MALDWCDFCYKRRRVVVNWSVSLDHTKSWSKFSVNFVEGHVDCINKSQGTQRKQPEMGLQRGHIDARYFLISRVQWWKNQLGRYWWKFVLLEWNADGWKTFLEKYVLCRIGHYLGLYRFCRRRGIVFLNGCQYFSSYIDLRERVKIPMTWTGQEE